MSCLNPINLALFPKKNHPHINFRPKTGRFCENLPWVLSFLRRIFNKNWTRRSNSKFGPTSTIGEGQDCASTFLLQPGLVAGPKRRFLLNDLWSFFLENPVGCKMVGEDVFFSLQRYIPPLFYWKLRNIQK